MPEPERNDGDVDAGLEHMHGSRVPVDVRRNVLGRQLGMLASNTSNCLRGGMSTLP